MALSKPSSTDPVYTPGTARGAKLAALLVDEGTALVRKIFEDEVKKMNPPSLREQLKKHKRYLYHGQLFKKNGKNHRVNLNAGQKNTLYPASGDVPDTAQGFDISLLELLLKELVWLELGRDAPFSAERDRLRQYRNNNYGHISSTDLSEADFNRLWKELTDILVALGGDRDKSLERLNSSIDPEMERKHFELLERLYKEDLILAQLKKGQEETLDQGNRLLKGQKTLLDQGEIQKKVQEEILDQLQSLTKGQEEFQSLLVRDAQSPGTESGQREDSGSRPVLEHIRDNQSPGASTKHCAESSSQTDQGAGYSYVPDDVITCLHDLYATEYAHVRPLPWCEDLNLHLGEVYTSLHLQYRDGRGRFEDTDTMIIVSFADIYNTNTCEDSKVKVRKIRVEGDPGIGKSCSCQKLAYDWSCGKLDRFKVVFFLEMRHLAGKVKDEIFEQLLPKDTKTTPDQLWSYIQQNQDDILFILDGLDELSQAARQVTDVVDLIQGKILRNCHVLVTSRPYHCVKDLEKCHQFYRIVGLSWYNSEEFVYKYFCESPESASKLVERLHTNRNLSEIVVNPLNNLLICVVWEDNNGQLPSSEAELYEMIVLSVAKRFCSKKSLTMEGEKLPPDIKAALRGLGKLSWEGLEQEQLQFNIADITKTYGTNADNMLTMGLLTRDYSFSRIKRTRLCTFLHKTFQEYMAARYISGLFTDGSSREEGMKCLRSLFGLTKDIGVDRELISNSGYKYMEVQDWLLLILGENADPLFDMFAEELNKAQTDEDRDALSFVCITWLAKTCAGAKMTEIVAPCLSQHLTNYLDDLSVYSDRHIDWLVGLTHVLTCQKKQTVSNDLRLTQHLTVNCSFISAESSDQEKFDMLEEALSDYEALRSVTLHETGSYVSHTFSPLHTFIPRSGTENVSIHINPPLMNPTVCTDALYLLLLSSLEQLSMAPRIEHIRISVGTVMGPRGRFDDTPEADFSKYDRLLARMIARQSCLRSIRLDIGGWRRQDPEVRGFGNLTETLQSISKHATLEDVEFELPRYDVLPVRNVDYVIKETQEALVVAPMVHELIECIKKNKVLKALRLRWKFLDTRDLKIWDVFESYNDIKITHYNGECSTESLSSLCSAIQENRTLEALVIEEMFCNGFTCKGYQMKALTGLESMAIIDELMRNKPSNYKEFGITMVTCLPFDSYLVRSD